MKTIKTNIVNELKTKIEITAKILGYEIKFTQSNSKKNYSCISRIYIFPVTKIVKRSTNKNILKLWEFNQSQKIGITKKCYRYRVYSEVNLYLKQVKNNEI